MVQTAHFLGISGGGGNSPSFGVGTLPVATYGDFNAIEWDSLPSGRYTIFGPGDSYFNLPTGYVLLSTSDYIFTIEHTNVTGNYYDNVIFTSTSDFTNNNLGRPAIRAGSNFGSATSVGWRIIGYKAELSYYLDARRMTTTAFPTTPIPFVWNIIATETGTPSYNTLSGEFTAPFTGVFTFAFTHAARATVGSSDTVYSAADIDSGSGFAPVVDSADIYNVLSNVTFNQLESTATNRFVAGQKLRFPFWCLSGSTTGNIPIAPYNVPASRLLITGVETQ